ncbi:hypothetical protein RF11_09637 [Thelohanellus kitauei]|uniref:Uncharacterized protein n=1 Tax=Thelohanellus kitauei TaxID=669202 RepID=A0A0C2J7F4_THEKT|nr:hypothetical protein RF11_09637 [Thelohanellus kitauei]
MEYDESNDISDTVSVAVFFRTINDNFNFIEELLALELTHSTTEGSDFLETFSFLREKTERVKLANIYGAPSMIVNKSGCVNEIRSKALHRRELMEFLFDSKEEYGELLLHREII